jgi:hypothetical protein
MQKRLQTETHQLQKPQKNLEDRVTIGCFQSQTNIENLTPSGPPSAPPDTAEKPTHHPHETRSQKPHDHPPTKQTRYDTRYQASSTPSDPKTSPKPRAASHAPESATNYKPKNATAADANKR